MNPKIRIAAALLSLMLLPALNVRGEVSLDSCRNMALRNNKTLRAADEAVRSADFERKSAKSAYLPGVDFTAAYAYNQRKTRLLSSHAELPPITSVPGVGDLLGGLGEMTGNPALGQQLAGALGSIGDGLLDGVKDLLTFDTRQVFGGVVTLTQPVYMGGTIRALNKIAEHSESALTSARDQARQDVVFAVDEAYWTVVSLVAKRRLAESFVTLIDTLHYNVNAMVDAGVATRSDLLNVDVSRNAARLALTKVDNGLTLSRMALAEVCGLPVNTQMTLADEEGRGVDGQMPAYAYDMRDVYASRQDLEAVRQGIRVLEAREDLVKGSMLPKLGIVGSYSFMTPNLYNGFSRDIKGNFSIGAGLSIPIWHWGGNLNRYKAAKAQTNAQRILLEDLEQKVELQVNQAKFQYEEAFKTYDIAMSSMTAAEENLRNANLGFREGMNTINDVILAQTGWLQAQSERIDAEIGIHLCRVYLTKVLGRL